ncbi:pectate lyase [Mariniflexile litorale]|uniref:Pectate lyase n=1 Tax=Mariniflexile litorale TaxID=3045158 RepID=A0AAU7EKG0_9FLAO|nr:pectate lyase [Mariniflexile sp. KMM 9835]MDQ8210633.1 pectate lyase [Mariniflexile sp. KMM 9835]
MMKKLKGLKAFFALVFMISCSSDNPVDVNSKNILVKNVIINGSDIVDGKAKQLVVAVLPNNATNKTITWSVSDESIAVISSSGLLTPVENGTVTVTATTNDESGISAEKVITISGVSGPPVFVESISITGTDISDGQPQQLSVQVLPVTASNRIVTWEVSDALYASISSTGLLTPKLNGVVTITAIATDGSGKVGQLQITISGLVPVYATILKAENMLLWQRTNGGWPKEPHNDFSGYERVQTSSEIATANSGKNKTDTTIDNGHTITEVRFLLSSYKATQNPEYLAAAIRGIDWIFEAQYDNGGWPQVYPIEPGDYSRYITYNDNAMGNVMNLMRDIFLKKNNLDLIDIRYVSQAQIAFDKGVDVILKTQIVVNGTKTAWCAQHDQVTLLPADARSYELKSISGSESVGVVRILMTIDSPSSEVIDAVNKAVAWFESSKIVGYNLVSVTGDQYETGKDKILVEAPGNIMWGRFYDLVTNQPFFCSRDGIKRSAIAEITHERRNGYSWYGNWPSSLIGSEYSNWKTKHGI